MLLKLLISILLISSSLYSMQIARLDTLCAQIVINDVMNGKLPYDKLNKLPEGAQSALRDTICKQYSPILWKLFSKEANITELGVGHDDRVDAVAIYPDKCVTSALDGTIKIWDIATAQCLETIKKRGPVVGNQVAMDWVNEVCTVSFIYGDMQIEQYNTKTGKFLLEKPIDYPDINVLRKNATKNIFNYSNDPQRIPFAMSPDGKFKITAGQRSMFFLPTNEETIRYTLGSKWGCAVISNTGKFFIISDKDVITMLDPETHRTLFVFDCQDPKKKNIESLDISPDNLSFMTSYKKTAKIISIKKAVSDASPEELLQRIKAEFDKDILYIGVRPESSGRYNISIRKEDVIRTTLGLGLGLILCRNNSPWKSGGMALASSLGAVYFYVKGDSCYEHSIGINPDENKSYIYWGARLHTLGDLCLGIAIGSGIKYIMSLSRMKK